MKTQVSKEILHTWKEIAQYVGQNIRTCQRWEKELEFPVHRISEYPNSRVFTYKNEIDAWLNKRLNNKKNILFRIPGAIRTAVMLLAGIVVVLAALFSLNF